jgi:hypothetical protein
LYISNGLHCLCVYRGLPSINSTTISGAFVFNFPSQYSTSAIHHDSFKAVTLLLPVEIVFLLTHLIVTQNFTRHLCTASFKMLSNNFILGLAACIVPAFAHPTTGPRAVNVAHNTFNCGTEPSAEFLATAQDFAAAERNGTFAKVDFSIAATVTINTYVHVVGASESEYITADEVTQQIAYMNDAYSSTGFQFTLTDTDFTTNSDWAVDGAELEMKKALRKGTYADLNLYFLPEVGGANSGLLGVRQPYC